MTTEKFEDLFCLPSFSMLDWRRPSSPRVDLLYFKSLTPRKTQRPSLPSFQRSICHNNEILAEDDIMTEVGDKDLETMPRTAFEESALSTMKVTLLDEFIQTMDVLQSQSPSGVAKSSPAPSPASEGTPILQRWYSLPGPKHVEFDSKDFQRTPQSFISSSNRMPRSPCPARPVRGSPKYSATTDYWTYNLAQPPGKNCPRARRAIPHRDQRRRQSPRQQDTRSRGPKDEMWAILRTIEVPIEGSQALLEGVGSATGRDWHSEGANCVNAGGYPVHGMVGYEWLMGLAIGGEGEYEENGRERGCYGLEQERVV